MVMAQSALGAAIEGRRPRHRRLPINKRINRRYPMITLHRLGHAVDPFQINPDVIVTVEAMPDTVITIVNGQKIVVAEPPERVADEIAAYRATILAQALNRRHELREEQGQLRRVVPLRKPSSATLAVHAVSEPHQSA
ncbi:MAG: flagellar FlbD family protein [Solirubrobacteraceae bacterium]